MKRVTVLAVLGLALALAGTPVSAQEKLDRTVLPIPEPQHKPITELDARNVKAPARFEVKARPAPPTS